jgi:hypothetical protein
MVRETRNHAVPKGDSAGVEVLRRQYESQGYRVLDRLPISEDDSLSAYRPDLILQKDDEVVVVEMKRPVELREAADLRTLRNDIERHRGWHLRVLYVDAFDQRPSLTKTAPGKVVTDYYKRADRAREALKKGYLEEAVVLLWIALEGVLRAYFGRRGEAPNKGVTVLSMLRRLHDDGMLDEPEMKLLAGGYDARNLAVHALKFALKKTTIQQIFKTVDALIGRLFESPERPVSVAKR